MEVPVLGKRQREERPSWGALGTSTLLSEGCTDHEAEDRKDLLSPTRRGKLPAGLAPRSVRRTRFRDRLLGPKAHP